MAQTGGNGFVARFEKTDSLLSFDCGWDSWNQAANPTTQHYWFALGY